ncbi:amidohydrolase [Photorhabdus aegyptia]|uniref:Putative TIM-barrel fold metal-dependent hydrolase n=1 Tax=Photorhabdus aegyptia TaxID=2805098 RepID=A0A022PKM5_9GAMM|nr:amidohydrolase [Photorhabdus aegyptia]EYU16672.1 putative TIM-barrel fold metal-dependent hydrolase [Photorhabdus aegyptia]
MCQACVGKLLGTISALHLCEPQSSIDIDKEISETSATEASVVMQWPPPDKKADIIFHAKLEDGSRIITMDESYNLYEALAIADGKILAVGTFQDIEKLQSYKTRMVCLEEGHTLLPGFIDPHQHTLTGSVIKEFSIDCGYADTRKTKDEVLEFIRTTAKNAQSNDWLLFSLYDNLRQGGDIKHGDLSMSDLNDCAPHNPVFVYYINMHTATANQKAFDTVGINPDPEYYKNHPIKDGGHFGTKDNKYNGMVYEEGAIELFIVPALQAQNLNGSKIRKAIIDWLDYNAELGNTTIHEAGVVVPPGVKLPELLSEYAEVVEGGNCRASVSLMYADDMQPHELDSLSKKYGVDSAAVQKSDAAMTLYGMKIVGDGSNQAKTAAQTKPYLDSVHYGKANYHKGEFISMVNKVAEYGWPVLIHCNGDRTLDHVLEAITLGYGEDAHPLTNAKYINRIEHCTITRSEQLDTMKNLGVQPSFLMNHVYYYGSAYKDQLFGLERANRMDPTQECVDKGIPFSLHTDAPCSNIGPLQLVHAAVNRKCDTTNELIGPEQRISLTEALRAVTINAATHIGRAEQIGSLEVGKFADLVILAKNPYEVDCDKLKDIGVCETWIGGKKTQPKIKVCETFTSGKKTQSHS